MSRNQGWERRIQSINLLPGQKERRGVSQVEIRIDWKAHYDALLDVAGELDQALKSIEIALKEPSGGSYWPAREFLNRLEVYNDDLNDLRVLHRVAQIARAKFAALEGGKL